MTENYRSASVILWYLEGKRVKVFLGYEPKISQWRHFGGKREPHDTCPYGTMLRELNEETEKQVYLYGKHKYKYFPQSKQVVYLHKCNPRFRKRLSRLKPTDVKSTYQWFTFDPTSNTFLNPDDVECAEIIPEYIRAQIIDIFG